jgi:hypothetical protein
MSQYSFKIVKHSAIDKFGGKSVAEHNKFFSLSEINQPVNQWLAIAFIGLICFWTVLTYVTGKAQAISDSYIIDKQEEISFSK